jgi:hypothetical protein
MPIKVSHVNPVFLGIADTTRNLSSQEAHLKSTDEL